MIKKKYIILFLSFLAPLYLSAQLSVRLTAGWNLSTITGNKDAKYRMGYTIGPVINYALKDNIFLESGLLVSAKGVKLPEYVSPDGESAEKNEVTVHANYMEVPVLVKYQFLNTIFFSSFLKIGPYFSYGFGGKTEFEDNDSNRIDTFGDTPLLKKFDTGIMAGIGWEMDRLGFELNYVHGLIHATEEHQSILEKNGKTRSFWFNLAYKLF